MGSLAGYKTISMALLIVLVALAGISPVFAREPITFDPPAACPGATVTISNIPLIQDVVGGGISIAAVSPLGTLTVVLSSNPDGLIANSECSDLKPECTFVVSESASCGHYTVTVAQKIGEDSASRMLGSATFDVAGSCCAVGGCVQPVNSFAILSPWLAVVGLIGCIGTVVVAARKRHP